MNTYTSHPLSEYHEPQPFINDDGGRGEAGYDGATGDCVVRAIAIATEKPYREVYDTLNVIALNEHTGKRKKKISNSRTGVFRYTSDRFMKSLGWTWVPTMGIGTGCKVHLRKEELPMGRLVVSVSKHMVAVVDGMVHDTYDPSRGGTRCVYGYWTKGN